MDVQTQDPVPVSEKEQLSAPPGWIKKLVPASAKSTTLRKHDVVFIAPDGQEVKSKWHLSRYLKAHPDGPASSEFNWSSGEEVPIRRSTRVVATTKEDPVIEKSSTRKAGKRNASELDSEQAETHKEKPQAKKRTKKAGKSADLDGGVQDAADVPDEVMHEATAYDNEATQDALPSGEVQKEENKGTDVEASKDTEKVKEVEAGKEAVTEEVLEVEASTEVATEEVIEVEASKEAVTEVLEVEPSTEVVTEKALDEVLDVQGEAVVPNDTTDGEVHSTQVTVVEVMEVITEREVHSENEVNTVQETGTIIAPSGEFNVEQAAMESEQPGEYAEVNVMESGQPMEQADNTVKEKQAAMESEQLGEYADDSIIQSGQPIGQEADDDITELEENPESKFELNEEDFGKVAMVSSIVEEVLEDNDRPSDLSKPEEEPLGPLEQKEEQDRQPTHGEMKERSPSEFSGSSVPVSVSNQ